MDKVSRRKFLRFFFGLGAAASLLRPKPSILTAPQEEIPDGYSWVGWDYSNARDKSVAFYSDDGGATWVQLGGPNSKPQMVERAKIVR